MMLSNLCDQIWAATEQKPATVVTAEFATSTGRPRSEISTLLLQKACNMILSGAYTIDSVSERLKLSKATLERYYNSQQAPEVQEVKKVQESAPKIAPELAPIAPESAPIVPKSAPKIAPVVPESATTPRPGEGQPGEGQPGKGQPGKGQPGKGQGHHEFAGKHWTPEQDALLWASASNPPNMGRTETAIRLRLLKLASMKIDSGEMTEDAALMYMSKPKLGFADPNLGFADPKLGFADLKKSLAKFRESTPAAKKTVKPAKAAPAPAPTAVSTPDQQFAIEAILTGESILLTGPAGTGKSFTIGQITGKVTTQNRAIVLTASTGTAALQIGGRTLHSWLGIGRGGLNIDQRSVTVSELAAEWAACASAAARTRIRTAAQAKSLLVIDEVSMLDAKFLDCTSEYLSALCGDPTPFGGIQVLFVGDFCQLPPVRGAFAFTSMHWKRLAPRICLLSTIMRQTEVEFQQMLQRLRMGEGTADDCAQLKKCLKRDGAEAASADATIIPTRLCALNRDSDAINQRELNALLVAGAEPFTVAAKHTGGEQGVAWAKSMGIPDAFSACIGAQVMVTRNLTDGSGKITCANGTRGVVTTAETGANHAGSITIRLTSGASRTIPITRASDGNSRTGSSFMPLQLAWAISIHKSQGATLDSVEIDLGPSIFEAGQAYTALSRARSLDCVRLTRFESIGVFRCHPDVLEYYCQFAL